MAHSGDLFRINRQAFRQNHGFAKSICFGVIGYLM